jgi:hypothetical protein
MHISAIELENFKGIGNRVRVDLKPITLLFGPNSAGKSTILHALMYLRDIIVDGDPFARNLALSPGHDLGGFKNISHLHNIDKAVVLRINMDLGLGTGERFEHSNWPYVTDYADVRFEGGDPKEWELRRRLTREIENEIKSAWVELSIKWDETSDRPRVIKYEMGINGEQVGVMERPNQKVSAFISQLNFDHPVFKSNDHQHWFNDCGRHYPPEEGNPRNEFEQELREMVPGNEAWEGTNRVHITVQGKSALPNRSALQLGFKGRFSEHLYNMMVGMLSQAIVGPLELAYSQLETLRYLGPLRSIPPRDFGDEVFEKDSDWATGLAAWSALVKDYEGGGMEHEVVGQHLGNYDLRIRRIRVLDRDSVAHILDSEKPVTSQQLSELWSAIDDRSPARWKVDLVDKRSGAVIEPRDVGVGISQLVPVIVAARRTGFMCVEQPELHLHPKMQVELGDIFIEGLDGNKDEGQFLIETHSEHLILRLLRRIREGRLMPDDVGVFYVDCQAGQGTTISRLRVRPDGDFVDLWPEGFFTERERELFNDDD